jgi:hypothetical protein
MNHDVLVKRFADGAVKGQVSNMFIIGDTLYSYGTHFPLLVRVPWGYIQNADKYSPTTSQHQGHCRHLATVLIPFSTLRSAGLGDLKFTLVDKMEARTDERTYIDKDGNPKTVWEHRPESCVIKEGKRYFISSMDGQNYFLTELPRKVKTVQEAFESLIPDAVKGKEYLRQGEWFFVPLLNSKVSGIIKGTEKREMPLYYWQESENEREPGKYIPKIAPIPVNFLHNRKIEAHHYATEYGIVKGLRYQVVRGTIRHTGHDHPMLRLGNGKTWYIAVESKHVQSWGYAGKVD